MLFSVRRSNAEEDEKLYLESEADIVELFRKKVVELYIREVEHFKLKRQFLRRNKELAKQLESWLIPALNPSLFRKYRECVEWKIDPSLEVCFRRAGFQLKRKLKNLSSQLRGGPDNQTYDVELLFSPSPLR